MALKQNLNWKKKTENTSILTKTAIRANFGGINDNTRKRAQIKNFTLFDFIYKVLNRQRLCFVVRRMKSYLFEYYCITWFLQKKLRIPPPPSLSSNQNLYKMNKCICMCVSAITAIVSSQFWAILFDNQ